MAVNNQGTNHLLDAIYNSNSDAQMVPFTIQGQRCTVGNRVGDVQDEFGTPSALGYGYVAHAKGTRGLGMNTVQAMSICDKPGERIRDIEIKSCD